MQLFSVLLCGGGGLELRENLTLGLLQTKHLTNGDQGKQGSAFIKHNVF